MTTVDEYLQAQRAEWGKYVATEPIFIGGVRAFNTGDPVPASHVEAGTVSSELVETVEATDSAESATDLTPTGDPVPASHVEAQVTADAPKTKATTATSTEKKGN